MFKKLKRKSRKGFTLVELLVVIAIIGILAAIAIPRFSGASESARGAKIVADLRTLDSANSLYYATNGSYAKSVTDLKTANLLANEPTPYASQSMKVNSFSYTIKNSTYGLDSATGRATLDGFVVEDFLNGKVK